MKSTTIPYHNKMSREKNYYSHITTGCYVKSSTIPISQQYVTWKDLLFPYDNRMSHEK
jgi:hypothetical protein